MRRIGNEVTIHLIYAFIVILTMAMPLYCFITSMYTFLESVSHESFDHHQFFFFSLTAPAMGKKKSKGTKQLRKATKPKGVSLSHLG